MKQFKQIAADALILENVDFIESLLKFKTCSEELLIKSSGDASNEMKKLASIIYERYVQVLSEDEVK